MRLLPYSLFVCRWHTATTNPLRRHNIPFLSYDKSTLFSFSSHIRYIQWGIFMLNMLPRSPWRHHKIHNKYLNLQRISNKIVIHIVSVYIWCSQCTVAVASEPIIFAQNEVINFRISFYIHWLQQKHLINSFSSYLSSSWLSSTHQLSIFRFFHFERQQYNFISSRMQFPLNVNDVIESVQLLIFDWSQRMLVVCRENCLLSNFQWKISIDRAKKARNCAHLSASASLFVTVDSHW